MSQSAPSPRTPRLNGARNGNSLRNGSGSVLAALFEQEGRARLLIARRKDRWEVIESRTLAPSDLSSLPQLFEQHSVTQVVRIAPGIETVARCLPVADADEASLAAAVALLAEAELPALLPAHRRAGGVLPGGEGGEVRTALLTGWMASSRAAVPLSEVPEVWTTPAAALAMVRMDPSRAAAYVDSSQGLMCLLVPGPERTVLRVLVDQPSSDDAWTQTVATALSETAQMAQAAPATVLGLGASRRTTPGPRLLLEPASIATMRTRILGVRDDSGWLDEFGLALGAILVAGSEQSPVRSLAGLHANPPALDRTPVEAVSAWLAQPRHAWAILAAAILLMLLGPLGLAQARLALLNHRADKIKDLKVGQEGLEKKAAMYAQLEVSRWPMTKLMADISSATPVGIVVSTLELTTGQGVHLQGTAESPEQINKLEANLNATRLFTNVNVNRVDTKTGSSFDFDVSAKVNQPNVAAKPIDDFVARPLAVRLYGDGASNTTAPSNAPPPEKTERQGRKRDRGERNADPGEGKGDRKGDSRKPEPSTPGVVPPPLSDADIAKMDKTTAMKEWTTRQAYVQKNPTLDAATKQRLKDEASKAKEQMAKAPSAAPAKDAPPKDAPAKDALKPAGDKK